MRKDGVNMLDKFLSNYRVFHQRRQYLSGNVTWGNAEEEYERDSGKPRGKEKLQPQSMDRVNIPYGNLYEMQCHYALNVFRQFVQIFGLILA